MLIALVGPERYLVSQALDSYLAKYAPSDVGDLDVTRLDGGRSTPEELAHAVQSLSMFSEIRVVVVEGLMARFASTKGGDAEGDTGEDTSNARRKPESRNSAAFAAVLGALPPGTVLLLVDRGAVAATNPILKAAGRFGKVEEYRVLEGGAVERWVAEKAQQLGMRISPGARAGLAASLPDLQAIANELDKLALYLGSGGTIDEALLREVSYISGQQDIFEMTSAAARRDAKTALAQLQRLLDSGISAEGMLPVLAWQVRTLIQVRDLVDRRVPEQRMAEQVGLSPYVVRKTIPQARQFSMEKLLTIHSQLLELDHAIKTGRADAELSINGLVLAMCQ